MRDLVRHMGGVHRWATGYVAGRRTEPRGVGLEEVGGHLAGRRRSWPPGSSTGAPTSWRAGRAHPTTCECWTFLPAPSPLAMWARRQAHETAIHRVDAELAAGIAVTPCGRRLRRRRHRRAADPVRPPPPRTPPRRCTGDPGGALYRRHGLVAAAGRHGRGHGDADTDERPGRTRHLHREREGQRSLLRVVEPRRRRTLPSRGIPACCTSSPRWCGSAGLPGARIAGPLGCHGVGTLRRRPTSQ